MLRRTTTMLYSMNVFTKLLITLIPQLKEKNM